MNLRASGRTKRRATGWLSAPDPTLLISTAGDQRYNIVLTCRIGYSRAMQTALRKMGNSTGLIVPKAMLTELGAAAGTPMDIRIEGGSVVATPLRHPREGWAEAAAAVAAAEEDPDEAAWTAFGNTFDDEWTW